MAETYEVESFVRRHHVFNRVWSPTVGEQLCKREASNTNDLYAVAVICVGGHEYTCVRVYIHVVYVRTRRLLFARI